LAAPPPSIVEHVIEMDAYSVTFRLPDSADLARVVEMGSIETARLRLLEGCVVEARREGTALRFEEMPAQLVNALAQRMGELDPLADISFKLQCDACHREIEASFDILHFAWAELKAHAERVQREIHLLAKTYGWSEQRILEMSAARRHRYCQMASDG
jgi:HD-GYP domain-containing protein (c-di-GMP phosphodiesterase class II)